MMNKTAIVVFIKNPVKGKVKTRLAKETSDEFALDVYHKLLGYTIDLVRKSTLIPVVYFSEEIENWESLKDVTKKRQEGRDLGERMLKAFRMELQDYSKVILIGSDCGELENNHLEQADIALNDHDIVLGPAKDGGYYLIGLKNAHSYLFEQMPWSQSNLFSETLKKINFNGHSIKLLEPLSDTDHLSDWNNLLGREPFNSYLC